MSLINVGVACTIFVYDLIIELSLWSLVPAIVHCILSTCRLLPQQLSVPLRKESSLKIWRIWGLSSMTWPATFSSLLMDAVSFIIHNSSLLLLCYYTTRSASQGTCTITKLLVRSSGKYMYFCRITWAITLLNECVHTCMQWSVWLLDCLIPTCKNDASLMYCTKRLDEWGTLKYIWWLRPKVMLQIIYTIACLNLAI